LMTETDSDLTLVQTVTDADGDTDQATLNLGQNVFSIEDDGLDVGTPQNLIMTNEIGNSATGVDLDIRAGTDLPISLALTPQVKTVGGVDYAVAKDGETLLSSTVDGVKYYLVYDVASDGSVTAYQYKGQDPDNGSYILGDDIFTLTPDLNTGTYTATYGGGIDGILDGAAQEISVSYNTGGYSGGHELVLAFPIPDTTPNNPLDNLYVVVTATDGTNALDVNYNASPVGGLGVEDGTTIKSTEFLTLNFTDTNVLVQNNNKLEADPLAKTIAEQNPLNLSTATFALTKLDSGETTYWEAYSGHALVASGTVNGTDKTIDSATVFSQVNISTITKTVSGDETGGTWTIDNLTGVISFVSDGVGGTDTDKGGTLDITYMLNGTLHNDTISLLDSGSVDMKGFDSIMFTAQDVGDNFSILSMEATINSGTTGSDITINVTAAVTDADGDVATGNFDVTFDADGNISGDGSSEVLVGGSGNDYIIGLGGDDTLIGHGGDDILMGGTGNDMIDGGAENDTVSYELAAAGVIVDLSTQGNSTADVSGGDGDDVLANIENVLGSNYNDTITGDSGANVLDGGAGNDTLIGGAGNDTLIGGDGNDILVSDIQTSGNNLVTTTDSGADGIDGGAGFDTLVLMNNDNINFGALNDTNNPIKNIEVIDLTNGDHQLTNLSLSDVVNMTDGNNDLYILGNNSSDTVDFLNGDHWSISTITPTVTETVNGSDHVFDVYVNSDDPTVTVKVEQAITDTL